MLRKIDPPVVWHLIARERVTHFCAAPTVLVPLASIPSAVRQEGVPPVKSAVGGAPPAPTTIAQMAALGVDVVHLYGLTETYGPSLVCAWWPEWNALPPATQAQHKARQGVPHVDMGAVRVVDETMQYVPTDAQTMSEVVLRSNTVMAGHFTATTATTAALRLCEAD